MGIFSVYLVKWRDSLVTLITKEIDTLNSIDTIYSDCTIYKSRANNLLNRLKNSYIKMPPKIITLTDSSKNFTYQSKINALEVEVNKYRGKYEKWLIVTICSLALLIISLIVHIIRSYYK